MAQVDLATLTPDALECEPDPHYELFREASLKQHRLTVVELVGSGTGVRWDEANFKDDTTLQSSWLVTMLAFKLEVS